MADIGCRQIIDQTTLFQQRNHLQYFARRFAVRVQHHHNLVKIKLIMYFRKENAQIGTSQPTNKGDFVRFAADKVVGINQIVETARVALNRAWGK